MKILVIGNNAFIGRVILNEFAGSEEFEVVGASLNEDKWPSKRNYKHRRADILAESELQKLFQEEKPDVVVNCAAISVMTKCEADPEGAFALNATASGRIAEECEKCGARLIHISTDTVFEGAEPVFHREEDAVGPVNVYGRSKAEAEKLIATSCSNYAIMRVVLVYGWPMEGQHGNIVKLTLDRLRKGERISIVTDEFRTPTYVGDIAKAAVSLAGIKKSGIWHICGPQCLSICEIAERTALAFGLDASLIEPVTSDPANASYKRPKYGALNCDKAAADFGFKAHNLEEGLAIMKETE